ncbi:hypothetical protein BDN71DRAFT_1455387 [Pleurotus eryngii]|uniref:SAP domain-containing protein n=1 Tax=Pleurotus eryngii TaxID=5323 RepID=A0A9P6D3P0_PLEER|nr:hypothetical protein BDN71DRAFT_1455387 [Pleurotus eryngii]
MPPIQIYSGSLQPKKKAELQEIAIALDISDTGTNYELQQRIKKHLDDNPDLEEQDEFRGLYGRNRRGRSSRGSVQPVESSKMGSTAGGVTQFAPGTDYEEERKPSTLAHRRKKHVIPLDPVSEVEATPQQDMRYISTLLKHPIISPQEPSPSPSPGRGRSNRSMSPIDPLDRCFEGQGVSSSARAIPVSSPSPPVRITSRSRSLLAKIHVLIDATRAFLSNPTNISNLTAFIEFAYIICIAPPWRHVYYSISPGVTIQVPVFGSDFVFPLFLILLHWVLPTLIIPSLVGAFVSFARPYPRLASSPRSLTSNVDVDKYPPLLTHIAAAYDPLTASIARLACHIAWPYRPLVPTNLITPLVLYPNVVPPVPPTEIALDVLGWNWRIFDSSIVLAFAVAEALRR